MMAVQFHIDIAAELERILPSSQLTVPSLIIQELENIKKRSKGKNRSAAKIALKLAKSSPIVIKNVELRGTVDDTLLQISEILCTNDRELRRKARERGIPVIYLRQKKYLAVDGFLDY